MMLRLKTGSPFWPEWDSNLGLRHGRREQNCKTIQLGPLVRPAGLSNLYANAGNNCQNVVVPKHKPTITVLVRTQPVVSQHWCPMYTLGNSMPWHSIKCRSPVSIHDACWMPGWLLHPLSRTSPCVTQAFLRQEISFQPMEQTVMGPCDNVWFHFWCV